jgi:hypothetical protein
MSEIAPTRQGTFAQDFKSSQAKRLSPSLFTLKRAWSSAATPLPIVRPTNHPIPPQRRNVFVDDRQATIAQHAADFVQHEYRVLCVMQDIAEQDRVEALVLQREMTAIVGQIIDASAGAVADVQTNHSRSQQPAEMMRDETVTTADVEHPGSPRQRTRHFQRHVVGATHFAAPSHALETALDERA